MITFLVLSLLGTAMAAFGVRFGVDSRNTDYSVGQVMRPQNWV